MEYIDKNEFVPILCNFCNGEQISMEEAIEGFMLGRYTLKDNRHPSLDCIFELSNSWEEYIVDEFDPNCFSYRAI